MTQEQKQSISNSFARSVLFLQLANCTTEQLETIESEFEQSKQEQI